MPMNCDQAIEFLPWLLNGTLEAGERDEVRRHLATCESCRAALNDTQEAWTIFGQHLPSDALVALAYGETPTGVDPAVTERHLASCPECAAELELARTSRHLEEDDKVAVFPGTRPRRETVNEGSRSWRAAALAAGLAGIVALSGWVYEFRRVDDLAGQLAQKPTQEERRPKTPAPPSISPSNGASVAAVQGKLEQSLKDQQRLRDDLAQEKSQNADFRDRFYKLSKPQANPWSGLLFPADVMRDEKGTASEITLPRNTLAVVTLGTEGKEGDRDLEILDSQKKGRLSLSGLHNLDGQYKFSIPSGLDPGRYTIQLYSNENGKRVPRESYKIRVE